MWALIVASGPSLLRSDVDALKPIVSSCTAVNCAVLLAPWADVLYGADEDWWRTYRNQVNWFKGERFTLCPTYPGAKHYRPDGWERLGGNSGHQALQLTIDRGAKHVALIGFDHQHTGGIKHYHGDHPAPMGNAGSPDRWVTAMNETAKEVEQRGVKVVNLSRDTALECFKRMTVEEFIDDYRNHKG